ncbi:glycosyltransferase [Paenibacillus sp. sgz5001063]|uniref:glycosyltransferase n=1 Tax=Paenibacillus sp. sgz5001063 TaxID=3242474 RepID=UPI0036D27CAE
MIVKNEEKYIEKCLKSVEGIVDEIIIVDTGSTDATLEIVGRHTDAIYHYKWNNDFAEARNFSISKSNSDYILVLDADEYLDEQFVDKDALVADYYFVKIKNYLSLGNAVNHSAIRMFKNHIGLKYDNKIHEHLNISNFTGLEHAYANFIIHHVGYEKGIVNERNKEDRNLKLLLMEVKENPSGYSYFNLGAHYKIYGNYPKAVEAYQKSYNLSRGNIFIPKLISGLSECLIELDRNAEAIAILKDAVLQFPDYTDFYFIMGRAYGKLEYLNDAEFCFKKCLEIGEVKDANTTSYDGVGSYLSLAKLADIQLIKGNRQEALSLLGEAIIANRHHVVTVMRFFELNSSLNMIESKTYIDKVFPIVDSQSMNSLLKILYLLRSPLLASYMSSYVKHTDLQMIAISKQYSGDYTGAKEDLLQVTQINEANVVDIILLCILLKDFDLLKHLRSSINISKKDMDIISCLIENKNLKEPVKSKTVESVYLFCIKHLIYLKEFDLFQYMYDQAVFFRYDIQLSFARTLYDLGFTEVAKDLSIKMRENKNSTDRVLERFIGDIFIAEGKYQEALNIYEKLINSDGIATLQRIYNLYKLVNYKEGCEQAVELMIKQGHKSQWLQMVSREG